MDAIFDTNVPNSDDEITSDASVVPAPVHSLIIRATLSPDLISRSGRGLSY